MLLKAENKGRSSTHQFFLQCCRSEAPEIKIRTPTKNFQHPFWCNSQPCAAQPWKWRMLIWKACNGFFVSTLRQLSAVSLTEAALGLSAVCSSRRRAGWLHACAPHSEGRSHLTFSTQGQIDLCLIDHCKGYQREMGVLTQKNLNFGH